MAKRKKPKPQESAQPTPAAPGGKAKESAPSRPRLERAAAPPPKPPSPPRKPTAPSPQETAAEATVGAPPKPLPANLLEWVEQNKPYKYALVAGLYVLGFMFIWYQEGIWVATFDRILARGTAYGVYRPVNLPKNARDRAALDDEEKMGRLPDEAAVIREMGEEEKSAKIPLSREELAAPERKGVDYLKKVPPPKAPWGKVQFHALPPSIYGKPASTSATVSPSVNGR